MGASRRVVHVGPTGVGIVVVRFEIIEIGQVEQIFFWVLGAHAATGSNRLHT